MSTDPADLAASASATSAASAASAVVDEEPTVDITVTLPVSVAAKLKHATRGQLDAAETLSLLTQLYVDAPLERGCMTLPRAEFGRICEALGASPQTPADLATAICELATVSVAGAKMRFSQAELDIVLARNAAELPPVEWVEHVFGEMKQAWIDGRI